MCRKCGTSAVKNVDLSIKYKCVCVCAQNIGTIIYKCVVRTLYYAM